jgi:hypothetical protein
MCADRAVMPSLVLLAAVAGHAMGAAPEDVHVRYATPRTPDQSCGVDSLYVCARASGSASLSLAALERDLKPGVNGVSAEELVQTCRTHGIPNLAVRLAPERLAWCNEPMILHVNETHFISFLGWDQEHLLLFDNQIGLFDCTPQWFSAHYRWDGAAVVVGTPSPSILLLIYGPVAAAGFCGAGALLLLGRVFFGSRKVGANVALKVPAPA